MVSSEAIKPTLAAWADLDNILLHYYYTNYGHKTTEIQIRDATCIAAFSVGEWMVSRSSTSANKVQLGYTGEIRNPNLWWAISLGSQGIGGADADSPDKVTIASFVNLAGTTSAQVDQIAFALRQHGYVEQKDSNGNYQLVGGRWIKYDYENRPIRVITADGGKTEFAYDFEGTRMKKTVTPIGGSPTSTIYIGTIYEETSSDTFKYIHAGGQRIALIQYSISGGANATYYFLADHLGSTHRLANNTGVTVRTTKYTPFGSTFETTGSSDTDHKFTGQRLDDTTDLYFYNARYYDPGLGRFVTPDIIVEDSFNPQSLNRYAYVRNNPINYIDPLGLWRISFSFHDGIGGHFSYDSRSGHLRGGLGIGGGGGISFGNQNWDIGYSNDNYLDLGYDNKVKSGYLEGRYGEGARGPNGAAHGYGVTGTYYFGQREYVTGGGVGYYGMGANVGYSSFGRGSYSVGGSIAQVGATYNYGTKDWHYSYTVDPKALQENYERGNQFREGNGYGAEGSGGEFWRAVDWIGTVMAGGKAPNMHDTQYGAPGASKVKADFGLLTNMASGAISNLPYVNGLFTATVGLAITPIYYGAVAFGGGQAFNDAQVQAGVRR